MTTHDAQGEQPTDDGGLDRSKLDFDPADNYFTGTVVDGTTEIPGPHAFDTKTDDTKTDDTSEDPSDSRSAEAPVDAAPGGDDDN